MVAASCLNRPSAVCLTGADVASHGLTSTTQPKRLTSFGSWARSKRLSNRSHLRSDAAPSTPYRFSRGATVGSVTSSAFAKYWLKFSSPDSTVPHGVTPPEQLFSVPSTFVPVGSADVFRKSLPAAGPVTTNSVVAVMRRLYGPKSGVSVPEADSPFTCTTDSPWAASAVWNCSGDGFSASYPLNMNGSVVYSWLTTSRKV